MLCKYSMLLPSACEVPYFCDWREREICESRERGFWWDEALFHQALIYIWPDRLVIDDVTSDWFYNMHDVLPNWEGTLDRMMMLTFTT